MFQTLTGLPPLLAITLAIVVPTLAICMAIVILRRWLSYERLRINNEIGAIKYQALGVVYAVLLGLTTVAIWGRFQEAEECVTLETGSLYALYLTASGLPDPTRNEISVRMAAYAGAVLDDEWSMMARGQPSPKARAAFALLARAVLAFEPQDQRQILAAHTSLTLLTQAAENRRKRLFLAHGIVPQPLLWLLVMGGIFSLTFPLFLGAPNVKAQVAMTAMLSILITTVFYLAIELDYPFDGQIRVEPGDFTCIKEPACMAGTVARTDGSRPR